MHVERMQHLLQTMKDVAKRDAEQNHRHFYMGSWFERYNPEEPCGTVACAWGWEATTQYAKEQGVAIIGPKYDPTIVYKDKQELHAAMRYFDISTTAARALFLSNTYTEFSCQVTVEDVIERIEYFIENGDMNLDAEFGTDRDLRILPGGSWHKEL